MKCFTTLKGFSELVDIVQITHSFSMINPVKSEAFESIKIEPEQFESVAVLRLPTVIPTTVEEVAKEEFLIALKEEEDQTFPLPQELQHSCFNEVTDVVEVANDKFMITIYDQEKSGQNYSKPVPNLLVPQISARDEDKSKITPTAVKKQKTQKRFLKQRSPKKLIRGEKFKESVASKSNQQKINCYVCQQKFKSFPKLTEHFSLVHPSNIAYFLCCSTKIKTPHEFGEHVKIFHTASKFSKLVSINNIEQNLWKQKKYEKITASSRRNDDSFGLGTS